jgi:hypothetical protein
MPRPGTPDGSTSFPQQMVVDYVHMFGAIPANQRWTVPARHRDRHNFPETVASGSR